VELGDAVPLYSVVRRLNAIQINTHDFSEPYSDVILPSASGSLKFVLLLSFSKNM
jgi:hypothetical protein